MLLRGGFQDAKLAPRGGDLTLRSERRSNGCEPATWAGREPNRSPCGHEGQVGLLKQSKGHDLDKLSSIPKHTQCRVTPIDTPGRQTVQASEGVPRTEEAGKVLSV